MTHPPDGPHRSPGAAGGPVHTDLHPRRITSLLGRAAAFVVLTGLTVGLARVAAGEPPNSGDLAARFELHTDQSLPTWLASLLLLVCVPPLLVLARSSQGGAPRDAMAWLGLATIVLLFSVDEVATFHEYAGEVTGIEILGFFGAYNWVVFGMAFVVVFALVAVPFAWRLANPLRRRLAVAAITFFGGAVGVEMLNAHEASTAGDDTYRYVLQTALEESLEMAGAIVLLHALLDELRRRRLALRISFGEGAERSP